MDDEAAGPCERLRGEMLLELHAVSICWCAVFGGDIIKFGGIQQHKPGRYKNRSEALELCLVTPHAPLREGEGGGLPLFANPENAIARV